MMTVCTVDGKYNSQENVPVASAWNLMAKQEYLQILSEYDRLGIPFLYDTSVLHGSLLAIHINISTDN